MAFTFRQYRKPATASIAACLLLTATIVTLFHQPKANAAGTASFSISPSSGAYSVGSTINATVSEDSGSTAVNSVEADINYDASKLKVLNISLGTAFPTCIVAPSASGGLISIPCGNTANKSTGSQQIATISFQVLVSSGSTSLTFANSSDIIDPGDQANNVPLQHVWNSNTAGATYTFKAATTSTPSTPPASGSSSLTTSSGHTSTQTSGGGSTKPSVSATPSASASSSAPTLTTPDTGKSLKPNTYLVSVIVKDTHGKPIEGATVKLEDGQTTQTSKSGSADFFSVSAGSHTATVTYKSKTVQQEFTVDSAAQTPNQSLTSVNVKLSASHSALIPIIYGVAAAIILGIASWVVILPQRNRFKPAITAAPINPKSVVVGNMQSPAPSNTPPTGTVITPTQPTDNNTNKSSGGPTA